MFGWMSAGDARMWRGRQFSKAFRNDCWPRPHGSPSSRCETSHLQPVREHSHLGDPGRVSLTGGLGGCAVSADADTRALRTGAKWGWGVWSIRWVHGDGSAVGPQTHCRGLSAANGGCWQPPGCGGQRPWDGTARGGMAPSTPLSARKASRVSRQERGLRWAMPREHLGHLQEGPSKTE